MSAFTPAEIEYLQGQQLGRLATVNESGEPHVVPVGFRYNAELDTIDIGGHNLGASKKFRDVARTGNAAFVVDDVLPPWQARGVEVRRQAEVFEEGGEDVNSDFDAELIRLHPSRIVGWASTPTPSTRIVDRWVKRGERLR
jgi:pyridoxamine 5'-phosphate oxidase family protein